MNLLDWTVPVTLGILALGLLFACLRLIKGPASSDRVVALDLIAILVLAFALVFAIRDLKSVFLDLGLVVAILAFAATVALARFLQERTNDPR